MWLAHTGAVALELGGAETAGADARDGRGGFDRAGEVAQAVVPAGVWQRTVPGPADASSGAWPPPASSVEIAGT